jgi:hypothetical protein
MYNAVITQLLILIQTLTEVKAAFDKFPEQFAEYPAVVIVPSGEQDTYLNIKDIQRQGKILLYVYANITGTSDASQIVLRKICTDIVELLWKQQNTTLSSTIDFPTGIETSFNWGTAAAGYYRATITYNYKARTSRY